MQAGRNAVGGWQVAGERGFDVVIADGSPSDVAFLDDLRAAHPGLVTLALTPFGLTGPKADCQVSGLAWHPDCTDIAGATKSFDEKKMGYDLMKKGQLAWDKAYEELSKQIEGLQFGGDAGAVDIEFRGFIEVRIHRGEGQETVGRRQRR